MAGHPTDTSKSTKKEIFHPDSRKAVQLARPHFCKAKLAETNIKRPKEHALQADVYGFFYHALLPVGVLTLEELRAIVLEVWLTPHDDGLELERAARRRGRPKSMKEVKLEEIKLKETEEYRTGIEVLDLFVELFRKWDQKEVAYVQLLRIIRISSTHPASAVVSRPGIHHSLRNPCAPLEYQDQEMSVDENYRIFSEPSSRFASILTTTDGPV